MKIDCLAKKKTALRTKKMDDVKDRWTTARVAPQRALSTFYVHREDGR